jgi:hypothetical protein
MAADLAREIVSLAVGHSPTLRLYRIGGEFFDRERYFDEVVVHGKVVTHKFVCNHQLSWRKKGFVDDYTRYTDSPENRVDLICNDPIAAMRIAFHSNNDAKWAIDVDDIRIYEFVIGIWPRCPLDEQREFKTACEIVMGYR